MDDKILLIAVAIICITLLETVALLSGLDGQAFSIVIGVIAALAGYTGKAVYDKRSTI